MKIVFSELFKKAGRRCKAESVNFLDAYAEEVAIDTLTQYIHRREYLNPATSETKAKKWVKEYLETLASQTA